MNLIDSIIEELKTSECYFVPSLIEEINIFVIHKLSNINEIYKNNLNKYYLLGNLVNLGHELENISTNTNNNILFQQLNFISGLFKPIINKIRDACLKINLELVNDYKNQIGNLIMSDLNKYLIHKNNIKFIQVNCLCKNINYSINKEVMFEDFGISIKITNHHFKEIFKNLIEETNLPIQNYNLKDKKSDWYWKAIDYKNYTNDFDMKKQIIVDSNNNVINGTNNLNDLTDLNDLNDLNDVNNLNDDSIQSFKIVQKIPESIQSLQLQSSNISNISNDFNFNQNINIIKTNDKYTSSFVNNSIIIDDDSFSIPIDIDDCTIQY